jgi:hypothetical protein
MIHIMKFHFITQLVRAMKTGDFNVYQWPLDRQDLFRISMDL